MIEPATTCATQLTRPSSGWNWAGSRSSPTSRRALPPRSRGTKPTKRGGGHRRRRQRTSTPAKASRRPKLCSMAELAVSQTPIPGLRLISLDLRRDNWGWFKENWQREKMVALGLPDFAPVQNNVSFNSARGATRGIHTEPWDKFVSILTGRAFGAWVDMREGPAFGAVFTVEMGPDVAVFVPRGVGNSYQALEDHTVYSYLVNDHWQPGPAYPALHL